MSESTTDSRLARALGEEYLKKHRNGGTGDVNVQAIADRERATLEEAKALITQLTKRNLLRVPFTVYSRDNTPPYVYGTEHLTKPAGLEWANDGFPWPY